MDDGPKRERTDCTDCWALPGPDKSRIAWVGEDRVWHEVWHTAECPELAILRIESEDGARRVAESEAWARGVFPAAHQRLREAAAALPPGTPAQRFADALTELAQAQADTTGFVVLPRWAEILERHFPPELPDPESIQE
ncbi:hypothetical protein [Streptomyces yaizuensis]|uniref:Uncharacterized protein n=1 Tax=Streptomyces yaizuensis TaxID=2989713 RepID=A0ABQ5P6E5_9ACTN|nr:hypothetical protein [Streptomyces sp. YSPA8]GLF98176.1 hypothetical protein SYYSPA8_27785 [Streptomyces sp. YSPA8]